MALDLAQRDALNGTENALNQGLSPAVGFADFPPSEPPPQNHP